jgi:hypothetical protein
MPGQNDIQPDSSLGLSSQGSPMVYGPREDRQWLIVPLRPFENTCRGSHSATDWI